MRIRLRWLGRTRKPRVKRAVAAPSPELTQLARALIALVSPCWASPFWQLPGWTAPHKEPKGLAPASGSRFARLSSSHPRYFPAYLHDPSNTTESPLSAGRAQVMWKGLSGMDAARAAMGQGWPFAAGPWNVTGAREPRRSRGRMQGQAFLVTFSASGKSDSPSRAKPMPQPTWPMCVTTCPKSPTASRPRPLSQLNAERNLAISRLGNRDRSAPRPNKTPKRKRPRLGMVFSIRWADGNGFFSRHLVSVGGPDRRPW